LGKKWTCKRGHGMFFLTTRDGRDFCEYILGYRMNESVESNVLYCGDLPEGREIPPEFQRTQ